MLEKDPAAFKSVFAAESGAALEAQERKTQTYQDWLKRLAVEDKRFHTLWNSGIGQIDRTKPMLKTVPLKSALKTLPNPSGLQVGNEFPPSMYTREEYTDPIRTYIVDTYGTFLRFENRSVDDEESVTRWTESLANGVTAKKEKPAIHTRDFRPGGGKPEADKKTVEKLYNRKIAPLSAAERDRPPQLYAHDFVHKSGV